MSLGGTSTKDIITRIMKETITNDLAKKFNWQGRGHKSPFSTLHLAKVIIGRPTVSHFYPFDAVSGLNDTASLFVIYSFIYLNVCIYIFLTEAAKRQGATIVEAEDKIKSWLKYSGDRNGGRKRRASEKGMSTTKCSFSHTVHRTILAFEKHVKCLVKTQLY